MHSFRLLLLPLVIGATAAGAAEDPFAVAARLAPSIQHLRDKNVTPLTLSEVEAEAMSNNREIQLAEERVANVEAQLPLSTAFEDPVATYRGWGVPVAQPWNVNRVQHMFMLSLTVPGSGKRELRYLAAADAIGIARLQVDAAKREITGRVRSAFFDLLRTYDELRLHDEQVEIARQAIAAARVKYTVGKVPQQDVLKAQVALTRLVDHLLMFERDADLARAALNTFMGRDPGASLEIRGDYSVADALPSSTELQQLATENRPELVALRATIQQSETRTRLAGKAYAPDLTIAAGYMLMPRGSPNRNAAMAELSVNLPWLNRGKHDSEIQQAQSEEAVVRAEYQVQLSAILRQVQEARVRAEASSRLVDLYRDTLRPQAQMAFRSALAAYQTDQTDFLNLLDSQNMTLDVEYSYFAAIADYATRLAELEAATGAALPRVRRPL